ncbi:MAG: hypothetical protein CVV55_03065, partial [Synergistetes bacterium HGW-Synergistetes-2]
MKLNRLGSRILVVVLALLIVSVGGIGFYAMKIAGDNTRRMVNDYEISVANGLAHELDAVFNRFDGILQALSSLVSTRFTPAMLNADVADVVVRQFASQNGKFIADLGMQSVEARSLFMIFSPEVFGVKKVFSVGFQRKDQDSLYMFMDSEQFSAAKLIDRKESSTSWFWTPLDTGRPYWGDLARSETGEELVTYTMPVVIGDKIAAVVGMSFDFSFVRTMLASVKIYDTGYPFLVNRDLRFLYHPSLSFDGPGFREVSNGYFAKYADDILNKGKGRIDYPWESGQKTMSYYTMENGYLLFVSASMSESLAAVGAMQRAVYMGIAAVLLVAVVVVIVFSRSLAKPLQAVAAGARNVAETGDLTKTLSVKTSIEEIKNVAAAVNDMIGGTAEAVRNIIDNSRKVLARAEDMSAASEQSTASVQEVITLVGKVARNTQDSAS